MGAKKLEVIIGFIVLVLLVWLVFVGILFLWAKISGDKESNNFERFMQKQNITNFRWSRFFDGQYLIYDYDRECLWTYNPRRENWIRVQRESILGCELKIDDNTEFRTSVNSAVSRAVVGGLLFGGVGAIVGGITGRKDSRTLVHKATLVLYFDYDINYVEIEVFSDSQGSQLNDVYFREKYNDAMYWCKFIEGLD